MSRSSERLCAVIAKTKRCALTKAFAPLDALLPLM